MVNANTLISYSEIITQFLNWIKSTCQNVDAYSSAVPAAAKSGYSQTYNNPVGGESRGGTFTIRASSVIPVVSSATIQSQLNDFLASRGLTSRENTQINITGAMQLYNNLATFAATKIVCACGIFMTTPVYMYKSDNTSFNAVSMTNRLNGPSDSEITTATSEWLANAIKATRQHQYIYDVTCFCCSSSSSSSSSCGFIVYMKGIK